MTNIWEEAALRANRVIAQPIGLTAEYPASQCFKNVQLADIPGVMEQKGFRIGAALMRRWFSSSAFTMPSGWKRTDATGFDHRLISPQYIDQTIVTMAWALRFGRTQEVLDELMRTIAGKMSPKSYQTSKDRLTNRLKRAGKLGAQAVPFGNSQSAVDLHETAHVNSRNVSANSVEKLTDPIDDMYCALGAFTLHAAAEGVVTPLQGKFGQASHRVEVHCLNFYLRDCYDFSGDQMLGNWTGTDIRTFLTSNLYMAENASFRQWRDAHRKGGDFLIFSDIHREKLSVPMTWDLKAF
ncbi:DUF6402 family protein [Acidovorax sp. SUPP3334]|uniref:DUF6402 family protein n=1 Tax=Acidovorax sp. SUPP3334 TaxID=2920881 RepID=UPI0023DE5218|nr:DUF6402 family protein [Acidovorax sp. SUPP3334]GKT22720.1 DUF6402 family protein [Acidovorax sp. SUPP3334]